MEMQAEAERRKRAQILESEGERQSHVNIADGKKTSVILESEADMMDQMNRAKGEAEANLARAEATSKGIRMLSNAIRAEGGLEAASIHIAEQYVQNFGNIAKQSTTVQAEVDLQNIGRFLESEGDNLERDSQLFSRDENDKPCVK